MSFWPIRNIIVVVGKPLSDNGDNSKSKDTTVLVFGFRAPPGRSIAWLVLWPSRTRPAIDSHIADTGRIIVPKWYTTRMLQLAREQPHAICPSGVIFPCKTSAVCLTRFEYAARTLLQIV